MRSLRSAFEDAGQDQRAPTGGRSARLHRLARRWTSHQPRLRALVLILILASLIGTGLGVYATGRFDVWQIRTSLWVADRLAAQGLAVPSLQVVGMGFTTHAQVRDAVRGYDLEPLGRLDPHDIRLRLEALPWVETAIVQRIWPSTFKIWLTEKRPMAIVHRDGQAHVLGHDGLRIAPATADMVQSLPNISGDGAAEVASDLFQALSDYPAIHANFVGAHRQSNRRWDLYLAPGVEVRLPADPPTNGLGRLQALIDSDHILSKDISMLDLRGRRAIISR